MTCRILVDADACPVTGRIEAMAEQYGLPVTLLCDTNHALHSSYADIRVIGAGADAVDLALFHLSRPGDIVITQDYGLAALALGRRCFCLHPSGMQYTDANIDRLLMERHLASKARRRHVHLKGPSRRTQDDDLRFAASLEQVIRRALGKDS